jgi:hypothetical protein
MTKPNESPAILVDTPTICRMLNRTQQSLRVIANTGKYFPIPAAGQWDLEKTVRGFVQYLDDKTARDSNKKKEFEEERVRKLKLANDETEGELVRIKNLMDTAAPTLQKIKEVLYGKLEGEMPIAVAGMDVPQSRIYGTRLAGELIKLWSEFFKKWGI